MGVAAADWEALGLEPEEDLGAGAFATVWAARPRGGDATSEVAVKIAHHAGLAPRFEREAWALATVGAPAVPALRGATRLADGRPVLVLERLRGATLEARLGDARLDAAEAVAWLARVAAPLAAVHAAGVVHRDVKPANLHVGDDGRVVVLDLGLAAPLGDRAVAPGAELTRTGEILGTPRYAAPELAAGGAGGVDASADVYALGVMLFEWLTGAPLFTGAADEVRRAHALARPPRPSGRGAEAALDAVVLAALAKHPNERPATPAALVAAARAALVATGPRATSTAAAARDPSVPAPAPPASPWRRLGFVGLCSDAGVGTLRAACAAAGVVLGAATDRHAVAVLVDAAGIAVDAAPVVRALTPLVRPGTAPVRHVALLRHLRHGVWAGPALADPAAWIDAGGRGADADDTAGVAAHARAPRRLGLVGAAVALADELAGVAGPRRVVVLGAPGLGKTRLLDEIAARAAAAGRATLRLGGGHLRDDAAATRAAQTHLAQAVAAATPITILLDDAHLAPPALLDALDAAVHTAPPAGPARLRAVLTATTELAALRPTWCDDAGGAARRLHPLDRLAAHALAGAALAPAEFVAEAALDRLHELAAGSPLVLLGLVDELHAGGAVAPQPSAPGHRLATERVETLAGAGAAALGARRLATLPTPLAALARVASVFAGGFDAAALQALQDTPAVALPEAARSLDAGLALLRLGDAGVLEARGATGHAFAHALVRTALEASLPPATRVAAHAAALAHAALHTPSDRARQAWHAAGAGDHVRAALLHSSLAHAAAAAHEDGGALVHATSALTLGDERAPARAALLAVRARCHLRAMRLDEAAGDLAAAALHAAAHDDRVAAAAYRLEEAIALDWAERAAACDAAVAAAHALVASRPARPAALVAAFDLAEGRARFRAGEVAGAAETLARAATGADAAGAADVADPARLMLVSALSILGREGEAALVHERLLADAAHAGDDFTCAAALNNGLILRVRLGQADQARAEGARSVALARRLGHPQLERYAVHNLAEALYLLGDLDAAAPLAARGHALQQRYVTAESPVDALLVLRIDAARGHAATPEALAALAALAARHPAAALAPLERAHLAALRLLGAEAAGAPVDPAMWSRLLAEADAAQLGEDTIDILYMGALAALAARDQARARLRLGLALERAARPSFWQRRLAEIIENAGIFPVRAPIAPE